jgi:hypothetical protein
MATSIYIHKLVTDIGTHRASFIPAIFPALQALWQIRKKYSPNKGLKKSPRFSPGKSNF